jgi:hypothetical protein
MGSGGTIPRFLDLGIRWRWVVRFTPRPVYPLLDSRLNGPQSWSEPCGEDSFAPSRLILSTFSAYHDRLNLNRKMNALFLLLSFGFHSGSIGDIVHPLGYLHRVKVTGLRVYVINPSVHNVACFKTKELCTLPTACIYEFHMIFITSSNYFPISINRLVSIMEMQYVFCMVRTEF